MAATDDDQLGTRPGNRNVQSLGLEEELGQVGGERRIRGGQREDDQITLLPLHAFNGVRDNLPSHASLRHDLAEQIADLATLSTVRSDNPDLSGWNAAFQ